MSVIFGPGICLRGGDEWHFGLRFSSLFDIFKVSIGLKGFSTFGFKAHVSSASFQGTIAFSLRDGARSLMVRVPLKQSQ